MSVTTRKMPAFYQDGRRHVNQRAAKLIRQHAGEIRKYKDLPLELNSPWPTTWQTTARPGN